MAVHATMTMTKDAFFVWLEKNDGRYELAAGRVVTPVRVTLNHARVTGNLLVALTQRVARDRYDVAPGGFGVDVGQSFRFPDVVVEPMQTDGKALQAKVPLLLAEVLSPGTLHIDFGEKRQEYLSLPSLDTYLILSPDEPRAWVWRRTDGTFPSEPEIIEGMDNALALPALGVEISFSDIYRGVK